MARYYLVDGTNLLYRAYHALQSFRTSKGLPTHAAYGFTSMMLRVLREHAPDTVAVIFDPPGPTQKHKLYADYKASRERAPDDLLVQIPYVHRILEALGIRILIQEGFEADDVLGTLARKLVEQGHEVTLVTGDKDFCQLVSERLRLLDTMRDKITGPAEVVERFGVPPDRVVEILSLTGDAIDDLPGVPGVGIKTAAQLLAKYGTLEAVVDRAGEEKGKKGEALREFGGRALSNRALVTIDTDVCLPPEADRLEQRPVDRARLGALFRELEFVKFLKELDLEKELSPEAPAAAPAAPRTAPPVPEDWIAVAPAAGGVAWGFAAASGEAVALAADALGSLPGSWREQLRDAHRPIVGHGLKLACLALNRHGIPASGIRLDCEVAAYLLAPGRRTYALEDLARDRSAPSPSAAEPLEQAQERARASLALAKLLEEELEEAGLSALYREVENPLIPILADMEGAGVRVDSAALASLSAEYAGRIAGLETRMFELAGEPFSTQSPKQLATILFEKLKLPTGRKTATGYSTDAAVLEELALSHPLPALIIEHRNLCKLKSTFIDALPALVDARTGRIHASFHQTVTATGRLSSSSPNLQNIPVRGEEGRRIREAFIAGPGTLLLSADYSQIELRILAHLCHDPVLVEVFRTGRDIHAETASRIFGVPLEAVDHRMRREAKTVNFGILYGISPFGLARQLGIGREAAAKMIEAYFHQFPRVRAFLDGLVERARATGVAETLFGRKRPIPELHSRNRAQREFAERTAVNTPIQGTAADLIKKAMVRAVQELDARGVDARLILQIHDELVFEVQEEHVEQAGLAVRTAMEGAADFRVPLAVEVAWGKNWYEAH
ncbi:MAG: DNA polymerase I [Deltaproteobacteria bacterium]|nr:DNA polymerase I [Deltaproteobacteria bacterium]